MRYKIKIVFLLCLIFETIMLEAKIIAKIPEASGICYIDSLNYLVVVNDEGWVHKITTNGETIKSRFVGHYDLEGVDYNKDTNELFMAIEGKENILVVDLKSLKIIDELSIKRSYKQVKLLKKSRHGGIEALAIYKGNIYVSNQSKITYKKKLKENASVILKLRLSTKKRYKIKKIYNHGYIDISGMTFYNDYLYMISDKKNILIKYDLDKNKTIYKAKLPTSSQEGICFDNKGYFYIADDDGYILKYKEKQYQEIILNTY